MVLDGFRFLIRVAGGGLGGLIILIQLAFFFLACYSIKYCFRYYAEQRRVLRDFASPGEAGVYSPSPQINRLLEEYDRQIEAGVEEPDLVGLVSRFVGNDAVLCTTEIESENPESSNHTVNQLIHRILSRIKSPSFVKFVSASSIGLGLLGTFIGFMVSLNNLSDSLETMRQEYAMITEQISTDIGNTAVSGSRSVSSGESLVSNVLKQINRPLGGMYTAFSTSVAGIIISILLSLLQAIVWNYPSERQQFILELRAFLRTEYPKRKPVKDREQKLPRYMQELLAATQAIAAGFQERVDTGFNRVGDELYQVNAGLNVLLDGLNEMIHRFREAALGMEEATKVMESYAFKTVEALGGLQSLIELSHNDSLRIGASLREIMVPMERFTSASEAMIQSFSEQEDRIENMGQELLGIMSSSVADVRRMADSVQSLSDALMRQLGALPERIMQDTAAAVEDMISPIVMKMAEQLKDATQLVSESWALVKEYAATLDEVKGQFRNLGDIVGQEIANRVEGVTARLLDAIQDTQRELAGQFNTMALEAYRDAINGLSENYSSSINDLTKAILAAHSRATEQVDEMTKTLDRFLAELSGRTRQVSDSSLRLVKELRAIFALDMAQPPDAVTELPDAPVAQA